MADEWNMPKGDLMKGKRGVVMGVANENSIAWGIAQPARRAGRRDRLHLSGRKPRAPGAPAGRIHRHGHDDLRRRDRRCPHGRRLRRHQGEVGQDRLPRPLHRLRRQGRAAGLDGGEHHARGLPPRDGYLRLQLYRLRAPRLGNHAGWRLDHLHDLSGRRAHRAVLQRHGRRQGRARSLHPLRRARPRRPGHPRQRDLRRRHAHAVAGRHQAAARA